MGMEILLRHSLGERTMDVSGRGQDQPIIVGRGADCDVAVPSVTVATRHCALFIHQGYWYVRDLSGGATRLDGQPVSGAQPLRIGSVVSVGPDELAAIQIEPTRAAAGHTGYVSGVAPIRTQPTPQGGTKRPVAAIPGKHKPSVGTPGVASASRGTLGGHVRPPQRPAPKPPTTTPVVAEVTDPAAGEELAWHSPSPVRPRRRVNNSGLLYGGIAAGVAVLGVVLLLNSRGSAPPQSNAAPAGKPASTWPAGKPASTKALPNSATIDAPPVAPIGPGDLPTEPSSSSHQTSIPRRQRPHVRRPRRRRFLLPTPAAPRPRCTVP